MCLIITKFNKLEIAQEDIKCYKILFKSFAVPDLLVAQYQDFSYRLGETYHTNISVSYNCNIYGLSFFRYVFYNLFNSFLDIKGINQGFHSYVKLKSVIKERNSNVPFIKRDMIICECIIPKGAKYYKGKYLCYDGYVSDSIKINKIICV